MAETFDDLGIRVVGGKPGYQKTRCPQCGLPGMRGNYRDRSLSANVDTGFFKCHYCGFKGRLKTDDLAYGARLRPAKTYVKPAPIPEPSPFSERFLAFFRERKIDISTLTTFGIYEQDGAIKFPYVRGGELVNIKSRWRAKDGAKGFRMETDCELIFYGIDQAAGAEQVVIVEGEMDVLAMATAGITAVLSVPNGASSGSGEMAYLESAESIFESAHTVILAGDNDGPGLALQAELARRIGKSKCCRVTWPAECKDANDVLIKHGPEHLRRCVAEAEDYPVDGAHWLGELIEDALAIRRTQQQRGSSTGWKAVDNLYTVSPGELTVVTGVPGSGKSEWLDALMINLARFDGWTFAVYSPENAPSEMHMTKLAQKFLGKPYWPGPTEEMSDAEFRHFGNWGADRFLFLEPETPTLETILSIARGFIFRKGIRGIALDPWNRMDHSRPPGMTLTEYVKTFLGALSGFARRYETHVWLMAHPRIMHKEDGKIPVPTPYDISDSAHFFNMADNCITVQRNKADSTQPVEIHVQKIRNARNGTLGTAYLNYDRVTGRYGDAF